ncbi:MAG: hypothetical protein GY734_21485 [Herbaspirillum sp.]|uniref:ankyrin repeat domain-containing protein n=1 Tax=Herbaspirillum sp. TaxID=1890675 RepID=UPI00258CE06C|nr:ankyrin repeat domain-containing protein [Herbaspirillum sp.]MCP3658438.1 hypothetical protein [Herbaspirillum sp.]MCP3950126.1 hypothetical protein [Herbaspirillum sp.]MCP4033791.1 hypothetical protein [Herbaspirillum sp.]MCP4555087.1 hypothetical protein [Herbaspirillum sp.]
MNNTKNDYSKLSDATKNALLGNLAEAGALDSAKELLEAGADPNRSRIDMNAARPLQVAFKNGNVAMVKLLMEHGATTSENFHLSQIDDCIKENRNYRELINAVLEHQPDKVLTSKAIIGCSKNGDNEFLGHLLTKEWTHLLTDKAMGNASSRGYTNIVETLREQGFVISISDIVNAACNGHFETANKLLDLTDFYQEQLDNGMLNTYRRTHDYDKTELFLKAGANPNGLQDKLFELCKDNNDTAFMDRLIMERNFRPIRNNLWPLDNTDDSHFERHITQTIKKSDLHEKLRNNLTKPKATSTKSKEKSWKI